MRQVTVNRKTQFHPSRTKDEVPTSASKIEWNLLLDPQHPSRQDCLDSARWLQQVTHDSGLKKPLSVWQFRGYRAYESPHDFNPWARPIVGPQWGGDFPPPGECAAPDVHCESLDWFKGYMKAIGLLDISAHPDHYPYENYYNFSQAWRMPHNSYSAWSYYMDWGSDSWLNRLSDYLVRFAGWADGEIDGPQALMLGSLKRHQVWPAEVKKTRLYDEASEHYRPPNGKAPITWWMREHSYNPMNDTHVNTRSPWGGTVPMFPATSMVTWWKGACSLPERLRWRLDRAGLQHWKVICDFGVGDNAWSGYEYIHDYYMPDYEANVDFIWSNSVKAAAHSDTIILDEDDSWYENRRPWVLDMKAAMAKNCELVMEVRW
jgi:hypothetical protein